MRPLELTFSGLRSYLRPHTIDLRDHTLVGITGPTGAGKSTIFEAIFFALYGSCTWSASGPRVLIADGGDGTLNVELTFAARGRTWKVTRSMSRGPAPAVHRLEELDGTGVWVGKRDVDKRVQDLIGLDQDTFIRSVLLPQGKFEQLLHTAPGARAGMLKSLLGLDQLDTIHDRARNHRDELLPAFTELDRRRASLLDDPRAAAAAADKVHTSAHTQLTALKLAVTDLDKLERERTLLDRRAGKLREHINHLDAEMHRDAAARLRQLAELDAQIATLEQTETNAATPLRNRLDALTSSLGERRPGGALSDIANTALRVLAGLHDQVIREAELTERIAAEGASISEVARLADTTGEDARRRAQLADRSAKDIDTAQQRERIAVEHLQQCEDRLRRVRELATQLQQVTTDIQEQQGLVDEAEHQHGLAKDRATEAQNELDLAAADHNAQKRMHAAAHAADGLSAGDKCPICTHPLPTGFQPPQAPTLQAAERREKAAQKKLTTAAATVTDAVAVEAGAAGRLAQSQAALASRIEEHASALGDLAALLGAVELESEDQLILAVPSAAVDSARGNTAEVVEVVGRLREDASKIEAEAKAYRDDVTRRNKALDKERNALAKTQERIAARLAEVPHPYQPQDAAVAAIAVQMKQAEQDNELLAQQWRELTSLQGRLDAIATTLAELSKRREREVTRPAAPCLQHVADLVAGHNQLAELLGEGAVNNAEPTATISEHAAWTQDIADMSRRLLAQAPQHLAGLDQQLKQYERTAEKIIQEAPTDGMNLSDAVLAAVGKMAVAAKERDEATCQIAEAEDLTRRIDGIQPHLNALNELISLLKDGKFVAAVVRERQQTLLGTATGLLREMTLSRFAFGPELDIFDSHTGVLRDIKTLSGGETFQASLALALAVIEQASSTGGRTEALFLDEGFGTLDQTALAHALDALSTQVRAGRLVVVISHMRAVAQHVPALLKVEKSVGGSTIRWVRDEEKADLDDEGYLDHLEE